MSAIPLRRIEGKYEILEKLGEGGMGAVYKVRHRLLDDVRVIKMMRPQLVADEEFKARFQREAKLAIRLRHPNIAHLIDFTIDEEDGTAFIVMEFIDGMTLEEMLRNAGPPPLGLALEIAQQSLRALTCLHEKGFVHRDISPDNLMLTEDVDGRPLVKLIDLGIAKVLGAGAEAGHLTGTGIFLGKVRYSPPEQFGAEGAAQVDARGDLYSFGIVFYELLTGKYPISGRDHSSMIAGHLFRPPLSFGESDPAWRVPSELRKLVLKAMAKEPAQRFASARELGSALAALRAPGDVADGDLQRALARLPTGTVRISKPPGSTQDRLDFQFGLETTPSQGNLTGGKTQTSTSLRQGVEEAVATLERHIQRGDLLTAETEIQWAIDTLGEQPELSELRGRLQHRRSRELELRVQTLLKEAEGLFASQDFEAALERLQKGKALAPGNAEIVALLVKVESAAREQRRARDVAGVREEIEAALARSDFRDAEKRLYEAEASYGEQETFSALHQRLGELRRQNLEARRRAERIAAAARAIDVKLASGELDEAGRLLDQAVSTLGEEPVLAELRGRLEGARLAARQAEAAVLMRIAVRHRDEADLDGALVEAGRALEIDPDNETARSLMEGISAELARQAEEARQAAREAEIATLLQTARSRQGADDLQGALETAGRIFALDAENAAARTLVKEIEAEKRRRDKEARKAEKLAKDAATIESRLEEGDLAAAGSLLDKAIASHGEVEVLQNLRLRLEDLRQAAREAEIAAEITALVGSARVRREADDLEGALEIARRVFALDAENAEARILVAEIAAEKRLREEEARRAERLAASVATIQGLLDDGNLAKAGVLLPELISSYGETEVLGHLRDRLGELEEIAADKRRREEEARQAEQLAAEEARRAQQLAAAVASIDACLDQEDPEGAARLLPGVVAVFGDTALLRERWERIESLRRLKLEKRVADLVEKARKLFSNKEFEAALGGLREAGRLLPDHPQVQELTREIEAGLRHRDEEARRERELAVALSAIDACLEHGDLAGAARLLPGAVGTFGGAPALRERWERLEALQRKARVEALRNEAEALIQAGHLDRATRKLRQALDLDPGNHTLASLLEGLAHR